jgi:hypothetical protein
VHNIDHLQELCYIYHKRNLLGKERDRLRHKHRYLQDVKRALQVRNNYEHSELADKMKRFQGSEAEKKALIESYLLGCPLPRKYKDLSLSQMNLMLLESEAKVALIKAKVMKHTHKYSKRVSFLSKELEASPRYVCGIVRSITFLDLPDQEDIDDVDSFRRTLSSSEIEELHNKYAGNKEVEKMLRIK